MSAADLNLNGAGSAPAWRLIKHGRGEAAWNMAVDEAMLRSLIIGKSPSTLRLYQWEGYAVSVGRFQNLIRTIRSELLETAEIPIVRRITGGRGILHGDDLTLSIACRYSDLGVSSDVCVADMYSVLTGMFRYAFEQLGIDAEPGFARRLEPQSRNGDCFAVEAQSDLVHNKSGVKLVGGALHRVDDAILFQASIPLHSPAGRAESLRLAERCFQGILAKTDPEIRPISMTSLENGIVAAMAAQLDAELLSDDQTAFEMNLARKLRKEKYGNTAWTKDKRSFCDPVPN